MNMRSLFTIILCICLLPIGHAQEPASAQDLRIADPVKFDEWADIPFSDEKARLDNAALTVQKQMPRNVIYLVIYAGQRACVGEAKARYPCEEASREPGNRASPSRLDRWRSSTEA
jgi:hypothetical protein